MARSQFKAQITWGDGSIHGNVITGSIHFITLRLTENGDRLWYPIEKKPVDPSTVKTENGCRVIIQADASFAKIPVISYNNKPGIFSAKVGEPFGYVTVCRDGDKVEGYRVEDGKWVKNG